MCNSNHLPRRRFPNSGLTPLQAVFPCDFYRACTGPQPCCSPPLGDLPSSLPVSLSSSFALVPFFLPASQATHLLPTLQWAHPPPPCSIFGWYHSALVSAEGCFCGHLALGHSVLYLLVLICSSSKPWLHQRGAGLITNPGIQPGALRDMGSLQLWMTVWCIWYIFRVKKTLKQAFVHFYQFCHWTSLLKISWKRWV